MINADPIIAPFEFSHASLNVSKLLTPKPTSVGFLSFILLTLLKYLICSSPNLFLAPVTLAVLTIYINPLEALSIKLILSLDVWGVIKNILYKPFFLKIDRYDF